VKEKRHIGKQGFAAWPSQIKKGSRRWTSGITEGIDKWLQGGENWPNEGRPKGTLKSRKKNSPKGDDVNKSHLENRQGVSGSPEEVKNPNPAGGKGGAGPLSMSSLTDKTRTPAYKTRILPVLNLSGEKGRPFQTENNKFKSY